jgi:hypothetical protein
MQKASPTTMFKRSGEMALNQCGQQLSMARQGSGADWTVTQWQPNGGPKWCTVELSDWWYLHCGPRFPVPSLEVFLCLDDQPSLITSRVAWTQRSFGGLVAKWFLKLVGGSSTA